MAEIEAFLRTGEAPPAAPEPRPVASLPPEPSAVPADPFLDFQRPPTQAGGWSRLSRLNPLRHGLPVGRPLRPPRPPGSRRLRRRRMQRPRLPQLPLRLRLQIGFRAALRRPDRLRDDLRRGDRLRDDLRRRDRLRDDLRRPDRRRAGPPEPPKWTVLRALALAAVLGVLLILPSLHPSRSTASNPDGPDRATAAPSGSGYTFLRRNRSGTPVRWNPCSPIYYLTNLSAAPAYAAADLQDAVSRISRATGIRFMDSGTTTTFPGGGGDITAGGQAGPVVIAWADPGQTGRIDLPAAGGSGAGDADGLARTEPIAATDETTGHGVYVTGTILVGAGAGRLPQGFGPGGLGILFLHELGHLMGLGNVRATGQLMDANVLATPTSGLGSGDRAGLARLGAGSGCQKVPASATFEPSL